MVDAKKENPDQSDKTDMKNDKNDKGVVWASPALANRVEYLLNNELMSDVTFVVNGKRFHAHKFVLAINSEVFYAMFYGPMADGVKDINIIDCKKPEDFFEFLSLIYMKSANVTWENIEQLSYLRKKYMIMEMGLFSKLVRSTVKTDNCLHLLDTSVALEEDGMIEECLRVVRRDVSALVKAQQFLELKQPALKAILKQDVLNISEIDLFKVVDKWCSYHVGLKRAIGEAVKKREVLGDALYHIRFPLIEIEDFAIYCRPSRILRSKEIIDLYERLVLSPDESASIRVRKSYEEDDGDSCNAEIDSIDLAANFSSTPRVKGTLNVYITKEGGKIVERSSSVLYSDRIIAYFAISGSRSVWLKGLNTSLTAKSISLDGKECELEFIGRKRNLVRLNTPYFMEPGKIYKYAKLMDVSKASITAMDPRAMSRERMLPKSQVWCFTWDDFRCEISKSVKCGSLPFTQLIFSLFDAAPINETDSDSDAHLFDIAAMPDDN